MAPAVEGNARGAWVAGWALAALILLAGFGPAALNQDFAEPDNALRLVRVRDMLAGQGWFDSVLHRLNPPDGTPMHWAQWIDAVLAAPIALLTPIIGQPSAEIATAFLWPLGLLGLFFFIVTRIAGEIGAAEGMRREGEWAGAIIAALAFPTTEKFAPGAFDHHNVEIILGLTAILALIRMREHPRAGLLAGAALALAMATAAEGVPLVVAGAAVAGMLWLAAPQTYGRGLAWFGAGLAAVSAVLLPALVPFSDIAKPICDAAGAPFASFGVIAGGIAIALARLPASLSRSVVARMTVAGALGAAGVGLLLVLYPACAGGGYGALGEDMSVLWMTQISETRSLLSLLAGDPALLLAMGGAALAGLAAAGFYLHRFWREPAGWVVLAFLLAGTAVMFWQIRGSAFATAFAIPFGAWAVAKARRAYRARASAIRALALAGVAASSAAAAWASAGGALQSRIVPRAAMTNYDTRVASSRECVTPAAFRSLRNAPTGVMLNQFALGAGVLLWTDHGVLAGPYHRNVTGTMTAINAMRSDESGARAIVLASPADYVLACPATPETGFYARNAADGVTPEQTLSARLGRGDHPDWLIPVEIGPYPLKLYRIKR